MIDERSKSFRLIGEWIERELFAIVSDERRERDMLGMSDCDGVNEYNAET